MARYIDIDNAIPIMLKAVVDIVGHGITQVDAANIALMLEDASTADVAPKSEVDWNSIPVDVSEALKQRAVEKAKAEAVKEFAEGLKTYYRNLDKSAGALIEYTIDQKLKEHLGSE